MQMRYLVYIRYILLCHCTFQHSVEEKLIRERIGHKSNVLFRYEEASEATLSDFTSVDFSAQDKIVCSKSTICTSTNVVEDENVFFYNG